MDYLWVYLSIASSIFAAFGYGLNGVYKVDAIRCSFWRSLFIMLMLAPIIFFIEIPTSPLFYAVFLGIGFFGIFADIIALHAVKVYKGSGPMRILNFKIPIILIIGWFVFPESWYAIMQKDTLSIVLVFLTIIASILSLFFMTKNPIALNVLKLTIFPIIIYAGIDIFAKYAYEDANSGVLMATYSVFIIFVSATITALGTALVKKKKLIEAKEHTLKYSFYIAISWIIFMNCKHIALTTIPNPGYYSLIASTSVLWVMLYYKLKGEKDDSSPIAGICLLVAILILTFIVST